MLKLSNIFTQEKPNLWLWTPVLFGFGTAFFFTCQENFLSNFSAVTALFFISSLLFLANRDSLRSLIFLACSIFLLGSFYANFYQNLFLSHTKITGKIYVDGVGKVESIRKFYNPVNKMTGVNLVIAEPILYKSKFVEKKKVKKKKKARKRKPKKQILKQVQDDNALVLQPKKRKPHKRRGPRSKCGVTTQGYTSPTFHPALAAGSTDNENSVLNVKKPKPKKPKKKKSPNPKTVQKNYLNLKNYQEIDREFLDYSKNYQQVAWVKTKGREHFPNPPQKISINLIKNFSNIAINDVIAVRMMLQPPKSREFPDDFDFALDANFKKIGAYGFALGEAKILRKAEISNLDHWFISVREKIRGKILAVLEKDSAAIALAFLIGDQSQISQGLMVEIRNSGLAHLLSISGFHLALAGAIFFVSTRFILARSEYLILHFDLKKIAAISTIFGTYFYLKIAASPLPAQRAFLMLVLVLLAMFVSEKINAKRAIMFAAFSLILYNPYAVFNVSFQLSFAAILALGTFHEGFAKLVKKDFNRSILRKFWYYFLEIIFASICIQIATTPFLMHSFQNVSLLGFVANILAIPLTSFIVMPLGFLALFLMPIALEKYALLAMGQGILLVEKIAIWVANLSGSHFVSAQLPSLGLVIAILGLLLICLARSGLRLVGGTLFLLSFATIFLVTKPDILFDGQQKFFALYDSKNGLVFSKELKPSKERQLWMGKMGESKFKSLASEQILKQVQDDSNWKTFPHRHPELVSGSKTTCDETKCLIKKNKQILVLLTRNKISEICKNNFDVIVNLTSKYKLPSCIAKDKIKIDNSDFYKKGGHFFYLQDRKILIKTTS